MKRSALKPQSKKTRAAVAAHHPQRVAWLQRFTHCMGCGKRFYTSGAFSTPSVHEIIGGPRRCNTFAMPAMWLAMCFPCNEAMGSVPNRERFVRQLVLKLRYDVAHFDLEDANRIWSRSGAEPITLAELREAMDSDDGRPQ